MKNYTFKQVQASLINKGFQPHKSFGDELFGYTTIFIKESSTGGAEMANVEEDGDEPCTIDGLHPTAWWNNQVA